MLDFSSRTVLKTGTFTKAITFKQTVYHLSCELNPLNNVLQKQVTWRTHLAQCGDVCSLHFFGLMTLLACLPFGKVMELGTLHMQLRPCWRYMWSVPGFRVSFLTAKVLNWRALKGGDSVRAKAETSSHRTELNVRATMAVGVWFCASACAAFPARIQIFFSADRKY